jgi:iron only hydrogenase large subunit-like protein
MMGKVLKEQDPLAKVIFVGPCVAKKNEAQRENVKPLIDDVLTFEEIQALIDSRDIDMASVEDAEIVSGSYFGRIFARSGGLSEAIKGDIAEEGITDFNFNPIVCSGIDECKLALNKLKAGNLENNFIEGMACCGGCIGGPSSLSHMPALDKLNVDKYSKKNTEQKITDALKK